MPPLLKFIAGGAIGGLIGGLIWAAISYFTGFEVGYVAWGIGFLVGGGVRVAAQDEGGWLPGGIAVGIAVVSIALAKLLVINLHLSSIMAAVPTAINVTDEMVIGRVARDVAMQWHQSGYRLEWPNGETILTASTQADFPPQIWAEAKNRWYQTPASEQEKRREALKDELTRTIANLKSELSSRVFASSFGLWDILWFGLAAFTAFKVGSGLTSSDD